MKKIYLIILSLLFISNCSLNKVIKHHGVHYLDIKEKQLVINQTNKNDILKILGPPSTKGMFDNNVYIYIEKKTSSSKLRKLGKKKLLINNVLIVEIDNKGILVSKELLNKEKINKINFSKSTTYKNYSKRSFVYGFLSSMRQKINDPLGKKRNKQN
ncbi:outer membrane protein assembly factor BamE [Candidatus Pelagibacter sp.]|nr:outer membrane protein assembly factor BamE [Candidatus Pelagibacter sp.]